MPPQGIADKDGKTQISQLYCPQMLTTSIIHIKARKSIIYTFKMKALKVTEQWQ